MYRDVEQGLGVFESLIQVTTGGVRLPWLMTLDGLGYIPSGRVLSIPVLLLGGGVVWALWNVRIPDKAAVNIQFLSAGRNRST
jgi:hypothetical protein